MRDRFVECANRYGADPFERFIGEVRRQVEIDVLDGSDLVGTVTWTRRRAAQKPDVRLVSSRIVSGRLTSRAFFSPVSRVGGGLQPSRHFDHRTGNKIALARNEEPHGVGDVFVTSRASPRIMRRSFKRARAVERLLANIPGSDDVDGNAVSRFLDGEAPGKCHEAALRRLIE